MRLQLPKPSDPDSIIISFMTLRKLIGVLGISLPFVLVLGSFILDHPCRLQVSISAYYHTSMRNGLVGILCGVSLFLFTYHGYKWYDSLLSKAAGFFALCVAFFPTSESNDKSDIISTLHYITSGIFLVILGCMSLFLFTKSSGDRTPEKKRRNRIYRFCGIGMLVCVAGIPLAGIPSIHTYVAVLKPTLVFETLALIFFGVSWLVKGEALFWDK
ncbi:MAG: DUF998 domain-containing protein [Bacteroidia bacterium]|nr:DUF998 domain-containing protein [Bacteroidia bacterium]